MKNQSKPIPAATQRGQDGSLDPKSVPSLIARTGHKLLSAAELGQNPLEVCTDEEARVLPSEFSSAAQAIPRLDENVAQVAEDIRLCAAARTIQTSQLKAFFARAQRSDNRRAPLPDRLTAGIAQ
jgi:hypothetical protein